MSKHLKVLFGFIDGRVAAVLPQVPAGDTDAQMISVCIVGDRLKTGTYDSRGLSELGAPVNAETYRLLQKRLKHAGIPTVVRTHVKDKDNVMRALIRSAKPPTAMDAIKTAQQYLLMTDQEE